MGKVSFDENSLNWILSKSKVIAETFAESVSVIGDIQNRAESEFDSAMSEVSHVVDFVQSKIFYVQNLHSECGKKIEKSERRSESNDDPQNAAAEEEMRAEMQKAYGELNSALCSLREVHSCLERLLSSLSSAKSTFCSMRTKNIDDMKRAESNGNAFYGAVENATNKAMEVANCRQIVLSPQWHGEIKIIRSGHDGKSSKRSFTSHRSIVKAPHSALTIKSATPSEFFASVDEAHADEIKIPSYNFHKLGGMELLKELENRGYVVKKTGGSIIGSDGYITMESKL